MRKKREPKLNSGGAFFSPPLPDQWGSPPLLFYLKCIKKFTEMFTRVDRARRYVNNRRSGADDVPILSWGE
jgi:hypothetical protein